MPRRKSTRRGRGEGTVSERPDGTWTGQVTTGYDENGKQKRKTVYGKTQAEALAKLAEVKQRLLSGTLSDTKLTMKEYLELWLGHKQLEVKPRSHAYYAKYVALYIVPHLGSKKLDKLTTPNVRRALLEVKDKVSIDAANSNSSLWSAEASHV